jgi:hypothetical protein
MPPPSDKRTPLSSVHCYPAPLFPQVPVLPKLFKHLLHMHNAAICDQGLLFPIHHKGPWMEKEHSSQLPTKEAGRQALR